MKTMKIILTAMSFCLLFSSCEKATEGSGIAENSQSTEKITYTIPAKDLVIELTALMEGRTKNNFHYNKAKVKPLEDQNRYEITIEDIDHFPTEIVCEGSGYSFATCVRDWFEANPNDCLTISFSQSDETYFADDDC